MLKKISYVLDRRQKINLIILLVIILVGAFVELLGVSAVMPLIDVAMEPDRIGEKWYFVLIGKYTGIADANQMIVFMAVVLIVIYILKNIYVTMMYNLQYRFIYNNQQRLSVRMMKSYMQQDYLFLYRKLRYSETQKNKSLHNVCLANSCRSMTIRRHGLEDIKTFHASLVIK